MQLVEDVLQNSCSTPLLKKQLNHAYEKLHRGIFYNRSRTTVLCLDSEFQMVEVPKGPEVPVSPRVQRSLGFRGSMGSWRTGGPGVPEVLGVPGVSGVLGSQDWVPPFYRAPFFVVQISHVSVNLVITIEKNWMKVERDLTIWRVTVNG